MASHMVAARNLHGPQERDPSPPPPSTWDRVEAKKPGLDLITSAEQKKVSTKSLGYYRLMQIAPLLFFLKPDVRHPFVNFAGTLDEKLASSGINVKSITVSTESLFVSLLNDGDSSSKPESFDDTISCFPCD
uniref:Uncharacterized protein n=1 Tax=Romanomermis culicivorax TaxID=13658 RepID=A0A915L1L4_ROMCU